MNNLEERSKFNLRLNKFTKFVLYLSTIFTLSLPHNLNSYIKKDNNIQITNITNYTQTIIQKEDNKLKIQYEPRYKIISYMPDSRDYLDLIIKLSDKNNIKPEEVCAIIKVESNWDNYAISKKNCKGLMQINPRYHNINNPFNPNENIEVGINYLTRLRNKYESRLEYALAAYNAGERNVDKWKKNGWNGDINKIPFKETRKYIRRVISTLDELKG